MVTTRRSRSVTSDDASAVAPSSNSSKTPLSKKTKDMLKTTDGGKISKPKHSKRSRSKRRGSHEKSARSNGEPASPSASQTSSSGRSDNSVKEKMKRTTIDADKVDSDISPTQSPEPTDDAMITSTPDIKSTPSITRKRSIEELDTEEQDGAETTKHKTRLEDSPPPRKRSRERGNSYLRPLYVYYCNFNNFCHDLASKYNSFRYWLTVACGGCELALPADTIIRSTEEMIDDNSLSPGRRSVLKRSHDQIAANLKDKETNDEAKSPVNGTALADKKSIPRPSSRGATGEPPEKKAKDTPSPSQSPARLEDDDVPVSVTTTTTIDTTNDKEKEEVVETTTQTVKVGHYDCLLPLVYDPFFSNVLSIYLAASWKRIR